MKIQSSDSNPAKGFTLVELLVTITIIITLAALSFMGVTRAKNSASGAVDANDMRAIGVSIQMFAADKGGLLPTTRSGVSPRYVNDTGSLLYSIAPYLGRETPQLGEFYPELAAASWQKATVGKNSAPAMLIHQNAFTGAGKFMGTNPMRPTPSTSTFGYPGGAAPKSISAVMGMINPATCLMMTEVDKLHPEFKVSEPSWLSEVPEGMAHGTYRLGLYWDGHVGQLDVNLKAK